MFIYFAGLGLDTMVYAVCLAIYFIDMRECSLQSNFNWSLAMIQCLEGYLYKYYHFLMLLALQIDIEYNLGLDG